MPAHNAKADPHTRVLAVNRQEQLDLYDSLPRQWQILVDSLPVPQDLREVAQVRARFGDEAGYQLIVKTYQEQYPRWRPESA